MLLAIGYSDRVIVNPDKRTMLGTWVPDEEKQHDASRSFLERSTLICGKMEP